MFEEGKEGRGEGRGSLRMKLLCSPERHLVQAAKDDIEI